MSKPTSSIEALKKCVPGTSVHATRLNAQCHQFAKSPLPILLIGPMGSEFESIASCLHQLSDRAELPFIRQRCASWQDMADPLRAVGSGTIFVDGIQHASLPVQLRLLEELDEANLVSRQIGGVPALPPRIIASTNLEIEQLVENGVFLDDLYWQLCSLSLYVPPLKERREDIAAIAQQILEGCLAKNRLNAEASTLTEPGTLLDAMLDVDSIRMLLNYDWPGNYRQLQAVLQRSVIMDDHPKLTVHLPLTNDQQQPDQQPSAKRITATPLVSSNFSDLVDEVVRQGIAEADRAHREPHGFIVDRVEKALIVSIMQECENIQTKAAVRLGINRNTLHKKIKDYGLE